MLEETGEFINCHSHKWSVVVLEQTSGSVALDPSCSHDVTLLLCKYHG